LENLLGTSRFRTLSVCVEISNRSHLKMSLTFTKTTRGHPKLSLKGCFYTIAGDGANNTKVWKCEYSGKCKARVVTND